MELISGRRNCFIVSYEGFLFTKDKIYKNGNYAYRCIINSCKSRGTLSADMQNFSSDIFKLFLVKFVIILLISMKDRLNRKILINRLNGEHLVF